jgi:hypothetical protein
MKAGLVIIIVFLVLIGTVHAQTEPNLLLHLKLDGEDAEGKLPDSSGLSPALDGEWMNDVGAFVPGVYDQAADMSGTDYVRIPYTLPGIDRLSGMDQLTISLHARKNEQPTEGFVLFKYEQYSIYVGDNQVRGYIYLDGNEIGVTGPADIQDTEWHQYNLTYNGAAIKLYVDGDEIASVDTTGIVDNGEWFDFFVGYYPWSGGSIFDGQIDDVRVYDTDTSTILQDCVSQGFSCCDSCEPDTEQPYDETCDGQVCCGSCLQSYHRADTTQDGCIDSTELIVFMNRWKASVADVSMPEMMGAIGLWKAGTGCGSCTPTTCAELKYECGTWPNGDCPGTLDCGTCEDLYGVHSICSSGICVCDSGWDDCDDDNICECDLSLGSCSEGSCVSGGSGGVNADLYVDFESGSVGDVMTTSYLSSVTYGIGSWSEYTPSFSVSDQQKTLPGAVNVGGTQYVDIGTRGARFDNNDASSFSYFYFDENPSDVSVGLFAKTNVPTSPWSALDWVEFGVLDACVIQLLSYNGNYIRSHSVFPTTYGENIAIEQDKWYWITMKWVRADGCYLNVYDADDWSLVGSSNLPGEVLDTTVDFMRIGSNSHGEYSDTSTYFDNIILDWTDATFPLLPGGDGSGGDWELPGDRMIDWSTAGIPGGIPERTTICATLSPSGGDDSSAIQTAIDNCPVNQVVYLSEGEYRIGARISLNKEVVLRGAGYDKTIINAEIASGSAMGMGSSGVSNSIRVLSGFSKGSTSIVLEDASSISIGDYLIITEEDADNSITKVTAKGIGGSCTWCGLMRCSSDHSITSNCWSHGASCDGGNGICEGDKRTIGQVIKVVAKNGNSITLEQSLNWEYVSQADPRVTKINTMTEYAGVEDLQIRFDTTDPVNGISLSYCSYCWIDNVQFQAVPKYVIAASNTYRNNYVNNFINSTYSLIPATNRGYSINLIRTATGNLIENNIIRKMPVGITCEGGCNGNVFAYNYVTEMVFKDPTWLQCGINGGHGAHPSMNLYEGNDVDRFYTDQYWGSSSHATYLRNRADGYAPNYLGEPTTFGLWAFGLESNVTYVSLVGNVFGNPDFTGSYDLYQMTDSDCSIYLEKSIYRLGYPANNCNSLVSDPDVLSTLLRYGNYDYYHDCTWDDTNSECTTVDDIPDSYYLDEKPDWFGSVPWPPMGPDVSGHVNDIPAKIRYETLLK